MLDFSELPQDGVRFEQLVRELLLATGFNVHWTGVGADGGRDLILVEAAEGLLSKFERRWLVSCKHKAHSAKSVGLEDIQDTIDACAAVGAGGFLLVCSTQPSSGVVKRLEELERQGKIATKFWDGIELEKRLRGTSTLPLVRMFLPKSAALQDWSIFNSNSPSFWAAFYKGYFIYLSCRHAHRFPSLQEIEMIILGLNKLEPVQCYVRPRAVYFDDQHTQYNVFLDLVFNVGKRGRDAQAETARIKRLLDLSGNQNYMEEDDRWSLGDQISWDVRVILASFGTDSFDVDHHAYYEEFIENFRTGCPRNKG